MGSGNQDAVLLLERNFIFAYFNLLKTWEDPNNRELNLYDRFMAETVEDIRYSLGVFREMRDKEEVLTCIELIKDAIIVLGREIGEQMFFNGYDQLIEFPEETNSVSELYRRAKDFSRFMLKTNIFLGEDEMNYIFSKAENEVFRNAVFEAAKEVMPIDEIMGHENVFFHCPENCLCLSNSAPSFEESKHIFLTLQDDRFIVKK